jgi:hypothetical protein
MWILASNQQVDKYMEYASVALDYDVDTRWNALLKMLEIAIRERSAIDRMCKECKPLEPLVLSELEWIFLGNIYQAMLPLYKKTLLVSQTNPTIFQSAETYWDLDDHFDNIIKLQGAYADIDIQIQDAARAGRNALDKYTRKMDTETLIIYSAAVLDPRVKTELLKIHLRDNAVDVINNLRVHFNEISPAPEPTLPSSCQDLTPSSSISTISFVDRPPSLQVESNRQRMLKEIQRRHYSTSATSEINEINDWLESSPIQEPVPDNMTAEQDIKWLITW